MHPVLDRHGLVPHGRRPNHYKAEGTGLSRPDHPNDLWCADYTLFLATLAAALDYAEEQRAAIEIQRKAEP